MGYGPRLHPVHGPLTVQYFHRTHATPDQALAHAERFFAAKGLARRGATAAGARFADARGTITVEVEIEGGHYTRVTVGTGDVGESELDRIAKRFLAELHALEEPGHAVRGAY